MHRSPQEDSTKEDKATDVNHSTAVESEQQEDEYPTVPGATVKKKGRGKKVAMIVSSIFAVLLLLFGGFLFTPPGKALYFNLVHHNDNKVSTSDGDVFFKDKDSLGTILGENGTTLRYAPIPKEFRNASCEMKPLNQVSSVKADSWNAPSIQQSADFLDEKDFSLPDAPKGAFYGPSNKIGSDSGSSIVAGHVDYKEENKLSPFGKLHELTECSHIYIAGSDGKTHEYVVTDLYTIEQDKLKADKDLWRKKGIPELHLITCSGPSVKDSGGTFRFNYKYNLVVTGHKVA